MTMLKLAHETASTLNLLDDNDGLANLDSLTIVEFVLELEAASHIDVPPDAITRESFRSLESIAELLTSLARGQETAGQTGGKGAG